MMALAKVTKERQLLPKNKQCMQNKQCNLLPKSNACLSISWLWQVVGKWPIVGEMAITFSNFYISTVGKKILTTYMDLSHPAGTFLSF